MRILLTNDDGIHAPGIHALHAALRECGHEVHVVAPLKENSGVSASLTLRGRLHVYDVEERSEERRVGKECLFEF